MAKCLGKMKEILVRRRNWKSDYLDDDDDNEDFGVIGSGGDSRAPQPLSLRAILRLGGRDLERVGLPDFVYILYRCQLFGPLGIRLALSRASRPMGCGHGTLFFWCSDFFFFFLIVQCERRI